MRVPVPLVLLVLAVILAGARPAAAQFYDLDGTYHCVTQPNASCQQGLRDRPPPPPVAKDADAALTLDDVIARVRTKTANAHDLDLLQGRVAAKDARAIEVLAWCRLHGIGGPADIVSAYRLYGEAADLGVPNARQNQIAIYESMLTPDQRQSVLIQQNAKARQ